MIKLESKKGQNTLAQDTFRVLLDCMARPGKVEWLPGSRYEPPAGLDPCLVQIALVFLDRECYFSLLPYVEEWGAYLACNTGSRPAGLDKADFIFMTGGQCGDSLRSARAGSLAAPEQSATVVVTVAVVDDSALPSGLHLLLEGPGIANQAELWIEGLNPAVIRAICDVNHEFPLGLDLILCDAKGRVTCIPRSCSVSWEEVIPWDM